MIQLLCCPLLCSPVAGLVEAPHRLPDESESPARLRPDRPHEARVEAVGEQRGGQLAEIKLQWSGNINTGYHSQENFE